MPFQVLTEEEARQAAQDGQQLLVIPNMPGGGFTVPRSSVIASVHYMPRIKTYWRGGRRDYGLSAVETKPTKPSECPTCMVYDAQQWVPVHYRQTAIEADERPDGDAEPAMIPMETIVMDLLRSFKGGLTGRMASYPPGIMQIAGSVPTKAEFDQMIEEEHRHCVAAIEDADELFFKQDFKKIGKGHRRALHWMGSQRKKWAEGIEPGLLKKAPTTGNRIPMEALVDDQGTDLLKWYIEHANLGITPLQYEDVYIHELLSKAKSVQTPTPAIRPSSGVK